MIRYALTCDQGHAFESWFQNSAAYDKQVRRGLVTCPVCGSAKVEKTIMAPRVAGAKKRGACGAGGAARARGRRRLLRSPCYRRRNASSARS